MSVIPKNNKYATAEQINVAKILELRSNGLKRIFRVVLNNTAIKNTVDTPAPTAASVNATSTAPIPVHIKHIKKLYAPKTITELTKSLIHNDTNANITTNINKRISMESIIYYSPKDQLQSYNQPQLMHASPLDFR